MCFDIDAPLRDIVRLIVPRPSSLCYIYLFASIEHWQLSDFYLASPYTICLYTALCIYRCAPNFAFLCSCCRRPVTIIVYSSLLALTIYFESIYITGSPPPAPLVEMFSLETFWKRIWSPVAGQSHHWPVFCYIYFSPAATHRAAAHIYRCEPGYLLKVIQCPTIIKSSSLSLYRVCPARSISYTRIAMLSTQL